MSALTLWNDMTRREQRIIIKLFGGGSLHGDAMNETINLMRLGLIDEDGLTPAGLEVFIAAFEAQRETRRAEVAA